jgi:hydrogenase-4 component B
MGRGPLPVLRWHAGVPGGDWAIGIDPLSAMFVLAVATVGSMNAIFGNAYMWAGGRPRVVRQANATYALLVAALFVVVTAQSTMLFLCGWEGMAIGSFLLIMTDHAQAQVRRAGLIYIVATHAATLLLFVMFAIWSNGGGDWTFASLATSASTVPAVVPTVLAFALVAFGVKAGYVPLHFWLPPAHAASPSHVSALMSGVVIKTGIYGLLRVLTLVGPPPAWWAWLVLALGAASSLLGVLWALAQHDLKRLLAYHSVENIGIILLGIGLGGLGSAYGHPTLAILGYAAAVLHTLNHALFKSLLFMAAGAVYRMTGTRNIEDLGGLARRMPVTFVMFLVGSVAIIGVPPLNGFVSEWLVYQGLFGAGEQDGALRIAVLGVPVLALVGGLALACFAKVVGVVFLGHARTDHVMASTEVDSAFVVPQGILAAACVAIGLMPGAMIGPAIHIGATIAGNLGNELAASALVMPGAQRVAIFGLVLATTVGAIATWRAGLMRRRPVRFGPTWNCGFDATSPRMQYTASSFAAPLISLFGRMAGVEEHRGATVFHSEPRDLVLDRGVTRLWQGIHGAALRLRPMQHGRLHLYLLYMVAGVLACLAYLVLAP